MLEIFILVLILIGVVIGLFVAWIRAEVRGKPVSTRVSLGIATMSCAIGIVWFSWDMYADGREDFDFRRFGDVLGSVDNALHEGHRPEMERLLHGFDDAWDSDALLELKRKIDGLSHPESSATPVPKQP